MIILKRKYKIFGKVNFINLGLLLLVTNPKHKENKVKLNHENIHTAQYKEMLYIFFPIVYFSYSLILFLYYWNIWKAYKNNPLEKEAYDNQRNLKYLETRQRFAWLKYYA